MLNRRHLLCALALTATVGIAVAAQAAEKNPFNQSAFDSAQSSGKPILVEVKAPWCPTCKAQAPILSKLKSDPRFKNMVSFSIDFDSQKDLLQKFGVRQQSTLIVFKGKAEAGRSTGDTNEASISSLLAKAI